MKGKWESEQVGSSPCGAFLTFPLSHLPTCPPAKMQPNDVHRSHE
jgi:hypothetical protein